MGFVLFFMSPAMAGFPSDVTILDKKEVAQLSNDGIRAAYMDTLVEIEAQRLFHATSGFSAKEFKDYKDLLKYRLMLSIQMRQRKLEIPNG